MGRIIDRRRVYGGGGNPFIQFADTAVKAICVANWGGATGGSTHVAGTDDEMTYEQAAAVTNSMFGTTFSNNRTITSFDELRYFTALTNIGATAFRSCINLISIELPYSVTNIGSYAFDGCSKITDMVIPNSVTAIGSVAFSSCTSLKRINSDTDGIFNISSSVTSIGGGAFSSCTSLTSIIVDSNNAYYLAEDGVLFNKAKTTLVQYPAGNIRTTYNIPNSVTIINAYAFYGCTNLISITIPNGVTSIATNTFKYCTNLISITIPSSATSIGDAAFDGCVNLTGITILNGVTTIGKYAFRSCGVTSITIPDSVTSIGNSAFNGCGLTSVTIGSGVTSIVAYAFASCRNLATVVIEAITPPTLGGSAFASNKAGRKIYVPSESVEAYKTAAGWSTYAADIEAIPT